MLKIYSIFPISVCSVLTQLELSVCEIYSVLERDGVMYSAYAVTEESVEKYYVSVLQKDAVCATCAVFYGKLCVCP